MAALSGYTIFTSYILVPYTNNVNFGVSYSQAIHCNYIKSMQLNTTEPLLQEIVINFSNVSDFKFLNDNISNGTGYTVHKIFALVQLIDNSTYTSLSDVKAIPYMWKVYDVTPQITYHASGNTLSASMLAGQAFKVPLKHYYDSPTLFQTYNITDYIPSYPTKQITADDQLCFGDETFFLGNVSSDIQAIAYTTDISILLDLNEFNSSTNATWNSQTDKVVISEIGIYDANKNLVAIGKLNNPIQKDSSIARTIVFAVDF